MDIAAIMKNAGFLLAAALLVYVVVLLLLRYSKYYRLVNCPVCGQKLSRHKRKGTEKWITGLSLGILPVKRYRCYGCYWEGQAFEIPKTTELKEAEE
ncbi:MAG: hypothetical protein K9J06_06000 [Flavobacteriales bacterium]|nr:hypothetical protein [Flavobacteriales bacterium]